MSNEDDLNGDEHSKYEPNPNESRPARRKEESDDRAKKSAESNFEHDL